MIALEGGNLGGLVAILIMIMVGPPIILTIIGLAVRGNNPKTAKVLFILAVLYLIVGLGICGGLLN
jgi:hypothetical protein